ncbi:MAG: TIGR00180 family glycosyltransferase [bacterium]
MTSNHDLTILLTLWDRVPCTFRWMSYANKVNFPFKVLIADGGSDETAGNFLVDHANFPNVNYEYIRYPFDATPTHYYAKVLDALNRIETPFVVMGDNDDFFVVEALQRSLEFLQSHQDFCSCRGIIAGVRITPDAGYGEMSNVYGSGISFVRQVYPDKSNLEATATKRVRNYFSSYRPNWYDVFRTEQTRNSFQVLRDLDTHDLILSQHIPMLLGVIAGKVQIEPYVYLFRQLEGPSSCDQIETQQNANLFDRMLLDSWSADFKGFLDVISEAISRQDGISIEEAQRDVKQGYRTLMTPGIVNCLLGSAPQPRSTRMANKLVSSMGAAGPALRKLYPSVRRMIRGGSGYYGRDFIPAAKLVAESDFKLIYDFLSAPPPAITNTKQTQLRGSLEYSSS